MSLVAEAASRLRIRVDTPELRDLVAEIAWAKVSNVNPEDYPRLAGRHHRSVASFDPETVARIFEGYEQAKRDRSRIDFEDILLCAAALMSEHPEVADTIRRTYRHLVVDEYQDVSPLQEALLTLWRGDRTDLCVVGDPAQTIHSFAGAQAHFLTGFARRFPDATVVKLVRDYRSTPQVVGCANAVMAAGSGAVTLQAQQPAGPEVEFAEALDEAAEAAGIADWLSAQAAAGVAYREMAVLFRINAQSPAIEQALADRGIPYLVRGGERFYERPEVRQALLTLRTEVRALDGFEQGSSGTALEQFKACSARWAGRRSRPREPVRYANAGNRWPHCSASPRICRPTGRSRRPADPAVDLGRARSAGRGPACAGGPGGDGLRPCIRPRGWSGMRWRCSVSTRVRCRSCSRPHPSRSTRSGGCCTSESPAPAGCCASPGRGPATAAATPASPRGSWTACCPARCSGRAGGTARAGHRGAVLSAHCRSCGKPLSVAAERKMGRHLGCPSTFDEATMAKLREWRRQEAAEQKLPAYCVFTDATLIALAEARPRTPAELIKVQGLGPAKADKYGDYVLAIMAGRRRVGGRSAELTGSRASKESPA